MRTTLENAKSWIGDHRTIKKNWKDWQDKNKKKKWLKECYKKENWEKFKWIINEFTHQEIFEEDGVQMLMER